MGSLQESLNKFKKQQEKCQTVLTTISKQNGKMAPLKNATSTAPSSSQPVKFSEDTARLREINNIRKGPVGSQIKRVIKLLDEKRLALTPEQINEESYVDINSNSRVFDSLKNNPKVRYIDGRFSYKPNHNIKNKDELLVLIRKFPEGIPIMDLKDAYATVTEDLQSLKAAGQVWLLSNMDSQEDTAYPNDPRVQISVDSDLKELFRSIEVPRDMIDIERELKKNGMTPATDTAKRRSMAQIDGIPPKPKTKKKKHEITKRTRLTNIHLPELFKHLGK